MIECHTRPVSGLSQRPGHTVELEQAIYCSIVTTLCQNRF